MVAHDYATGRTTVPSPKSTDGVPVDPHVQSRPDGQFEQKPRIEGVGSVAGGTTSPTKGLPFDGAPYTMDTNGEPIHAYGSRHTEAIEAPTEGDLAKLDTAEPGEVDGTLGISENNEGVPTETELHTSQSDERDSKPARSRKKE